MKTNEAPTDMRSAVKVKIKTLAAEAKIIRKEETKASTYLQERLLRTHRVTVVRNEARAAQIAYGYIRGKRFDQIEQKKEGKSPISIFMLNRIVDMVLRHGPMRLLYQPKDVKEATFQAITKWIAA